MKSLYYVLALGLILLFSGYTSAVEKKSECPKECQLRAKAALALAATKTTGVRFTQTAPAPREKVNKTCDCGQTCKCPAGSCPNCEVPAKVSVQSPTPTYFQRGNVIYECLNGSCRPVGIIGPK